MSSLRIDIVSDVVCPWCVIGFKRLEHVLKQYQGDIHAEICWRPFELNPDMSAEGQELREHLQEKYGSTPEQSRMIRQRISDLGTELGFDFQFSDEMKIYNTFKAHQLLSFSELYGKQTELKMALFESYFSEGGNISDTQVLMDVVAKTGLDVELARQALEDNRFVSEVREQEAFWQQQGIHSVPAIIFNQKDLISGAQDESVFMDYLKQHLV
ncbi:disulfide bond formation protein DsbA [Endozoicomonas sp. OPT23]|nr:disulfide bond formation protein DsbA [Endozoicomonas sp. OPT23]